MTLLIISQLFIKAQVSLNCTYHIVELTIEVFKKATLLGRKRLLGFVAKNVDKW